jgi:hypothetical protein
MEQFLVHLLHVASWFFVVVFIFAVIGFILTLRWIGMMLFSARRAVESGVDSVRRK